MRARSAKVTHIVAPVGGINNSKNLDSLRPDECLDMINLLPKASTVDLRLGNKLHVTPAQAGIPKTLHDHQDTDGTPHLFTCIGGKLQRITTPLAAPTVYSPTFTNDEFSVTQIDGVSVFVNGENIPHRYSTALGLVACTFTGASLTPASLVHVNSYRGSLWYVEKNSSNLWFGSDGTSDGALTKELMGQNFSKGGSLLFTATYGADTGSGVDDLLVLASTNGEILVFRGAKPATDPEWRIVNRFNLPRILGRRGYFKIGSDLAFITEGGLFRMSSLMVAGDRQDYSAFASSQKIYETWRNLANAYSATTGWHGFEDISQNFAFITIPTGASAVQLAVNTQTNAWTKIEGIDAYHSVMHKGKPYFGSYNGKIYRSNSGVIDENGTNPDWCLQLGYNYLQDKSGKKVFLQFVPTVYLEKTLELTLSLSVDSKAFVDSYNEQLFIDSGTPWNVGPWNSFEWGKGALITDQYLGLNLSGYAGSVRIKGKFPKGIMSFKRFSIFSVPAGIK